MTLVVLGTCQELDDRHDRVRSDGRQDMPPAMKFKKDTPWHTDLSFPASEYRAEVYVDIP